MTIEEIKTYLIDVEGYSEADLEDCDEDELMNLIEDEFALMAYNK